MIKREFDHSSGVLQILHTKLLNMADGSRKSDVCAWWLERIEQESRQFLLNQEVFIGKLYVYVNRK